MAQKPVLGKGLASLLPSMSSATASAGGNFIPSAGGAASVNPDSSGRDRHLGISMASVDEIHANGFQPRRDFEESALMELAQSIKTSGIIQPLVVRKSSNK